MSRSLKNIYKVTQLSGIKIRNICIYILTWIH